MSKIYHRGIETKIRLSGSQFRFRLHTFSVGDFGIYSESQSAHNTHPKKRREKLTASTIPIPPPQPLVPTQPFLHPRVEPRYNLLLLQRSAQCRGQTNPRTRRSSKVRPPITPATITSMITLSGCARSVFSISTGETCSVHPRDFERVLCGCGQDGTKQMTCEGVTCLGALRTNSQKHSRLHRSASGRPCATIHRQRSPSSKGLIEVPIVYFGIKG